LNLSRTEWAQHLSEYLPQGAVPVVASWITAHQIDFKIVKHRRTKLGDYRAAHNGDPHRITVNESLNPYSFLVTTVHEFAHFHAHVDFGRRIRPHGSEWKGVYSTLLRPFIFDDIFPDDLRGGLLVHMNKPSASSCSDEQLLRLMKRYDAHQPITVEQLPAGTVFTIGRRKFEKGILVRKRYLCREISTGRVYRVHPLAEAEVNISGT
jgi:hypothetical protein